MCKNLIFCLVAVPDVPEGEAAGGGGEGGGEVVAAAEAPASKSDKPAKAG